VTELPPLTWLYVPADRPDRVPKAIASGAHAVIVDLEDAVVPAHKEDARAGLAALPLRDAPVPVFIRVNAVDTPWGRDDLDAVSALPVAGVILPKVETLDLPEVELNCLIETPLGLELAFAIASNSHVQGLSIGEADLAASLGATAAGLDWARSRVVNAARAAGLPRPPQSVYMQIDDLDGLAASCARGRELGFLGRGAIHPSQLPVIEEAYRPTVSEVERARRVLGLDGTGVIEGQFVDPPIVAAAEQTVALATRYGARDS
jgi:citrate lyase subunit beta / citryl-CoA lyase